MPAEIRVPIEREEDVVLARQKGRELAAAAGFSVTDRTIIALAISEIARNIVSYAERGDVSLDAITTGARRGIQIVARDSGPGIADVALAMQDGYSTGRSLGLGLPGAKRLMDEFEIVSSPGSGTTIVMRKWLP
jgi:serine/threonine-protein kinase RsbT